MSAQTNIETGTRRKASDKVVKKWFTIIFLSCSVWLTGPTQAGAVTILSEDFTDTTKVNLTQTSAAVITSDGGYVRLKSYPRPNAIALNQFGDYVAPTQDGLKFFTYDEATGTVTEDASFSVPTVTDAQLVAMPPDASMIWALRPDGMHCYTYDEAIGGMSEDLNLTILGLADVLSVTVLDNNSLAVLRKSGTNGVIDIYQMADGVITQAMQLDTAITNPASIACVPGTGAMPEIVYSTDSSMYFYSYDESTDLYSADLSRTITGFTGLISTSANAEGVAALVPLAPGTEAQIYNFTEGAPAKVDAFSAGALPQNALAISMNPESYSYGVVTENGDIQYWQYDEATDSMLRDSSMELTGLRLSGSKYMHPGNYQSISIDTGVIDYEDVRLTPTEDKPVGTSIDYYVSSDGGGTFYDVQPNIWTSLPAGHSYVVKATMDTTNDSITPKILSISLEVSTLLVRDLTVTAVARSEAWQIFPTTVLPVEVKAGADVIFEVTTEGYAESVAATMSTGANIVMNNRQPTSDNQNTWWGSFLVPVDAVDPSSLAVTIVAQKGLKQKTLTVNPFISVRGKVSEVIDLSIIQ